MLLTRAPVSTGPKPGFTFDLHVLSLPPAFALSQDQTLRLNTPGRANASTRDAPFGRVNVSARSHSLAHDCAGRAMRPSVNHAAACASLPRSSQCQRADDRTELPTQQKTTAQPPPAEANHTTAWEAGYYARPLRVSNGFLTIRRLSGGAHCHYPGVRPGLPARTRCRLPGPTPVASNRRPRSRPVAYLIYMWCGGARLQPCGARGCVNARRHSHSQNPKPRPAPTIPVPTIIDR